MAKVDYIKQVQSRVNREIRKTNKELGVSKNQVRGTFEQLGISADSPSEEELGIVFAELVGQFASTNTISSEEGEIQIPTPGMIEITPSANPDVWEKLQPPVNPEPQEVVHDTDDVQPCEASEEELAPIAADQQEPANEQGQQEEETNNSIVAAAPNPPSQSHETNNIIPAANNLLSNDLIPQGEVAGMVNQAFANQPQGFKDQITEYAMQHTFENVSQVQAFLEQLRGMEFKLLVNTLNDHLARRGSMLTVLNNVLTGQKAKDDEASQAFFATFNNRLTAFQQEMESKLSKQGL